MAEYSELLALVRGIEAAAKKEPVDRVSSDISSGSSVERRPRAFSEMLAELSAIEGSQSRQVQQTTARSGMFVRPIPMAAPVPEAHMRAAAGELSAIASAVAADRKAPQPEPEFKRQRSANLVLPNLSAADQLSELEKIIESIKNRVFDNNQMEIVRDEVFGLYDSMKGANAAGNAGGADPSLLALRDKRLSEALSLLKGE